VLVKGGEDLRLDQRIQQLFQITNKIFKENPACENRNLYLKTFDVVPVTNRLGTFEWVSDTCPLKELIEKEHKRISKGKDLNGSKALSERRKWLAKVQKKKTDNIAEQHLALLYLEEEQIGPAFD
jgi:DNA-dependent protein kinase catalytic subunit